MNTSLSLRNAPEDMPPQEIAHAITSALDGLKAVRTFVTNQFVEGVDYGKIPGCGDKPALLNPGAQKAVMYFNSYPTFKVKEKDLGAGHVDFRVRAILVSRVTLHQIGEGIGCASTKEKKFRRSAGSDMKKCPQCGKAAVLKSKEKPEYFCWRKKDGCGAVFALNHPAMKAAAAPAEDNDAPYEVRNTVLKMAKKRALVDAAMTLGCLAELFTQDIEDTYGADQFREAAQPYEGEVVEEPMPPTAPSGQPRPQNKGLSTKESIERTKEFLAYLKEECDAFQKRWAGQWEKRLDRALDEGKEVPSKLPELINSFQAKNHLIKWAKVTGRTRPGVDPGESRSREVEAYLAEIFYGDEADQAAVIQELGDYISLKRKDLTAQIFRQHPDLAPAGYAEELAEATPDRGDAYEGDESTAGE